MDYRARFYDPVLARFIQPDTIIPGAENPGAWNRYTYVGNNPVNKTDPDGQCYPLCTIAIGAALGAMAGAITYTVMNHGQDFNQGEFLAATLGGAIAGGLIGTGVGILAAGGTATATAIATFAIGAGTGAGITGLDYTTSNPGSFETKPYVINTTISGAVGGISAVAPLTPAGVAAKGITYVAGAELQYGLLADEWTAQGAALAGANGLLSTVFDVSSSYALHKGFVADTMLEESVWPNSKLGPYQNNLLNEAINARTRAGTLNMASGVISGGLSAWTNRKTKLLVEPR